jgi:hypothetical protein
MLRKNQPEQVFWTKKNVSFVLVEFIAWHIVFDVQITRHFLTNKLNKLYSIMHFKNQNHPKLISITFAYKSNWTFSEHLYLWITQITNKFLFTLLELIILFP